MLENFKKVLVISPHTDDIELGAGGTVLRLKKSNIEIFHLILSSCKDILIENNLDTDLYLKECKQSGKFLGIKEENTIFHDVETRNFPFFRNNIREIMHKISKDIKPDLIIGPSLNDTHQDHKTVGEELKRAFVSGESIISYEIGKNNLTFRPGMFMDITSFIDGKIKALDFYQSQKKHFKKQYFDDEFIRGLARVRGIQSNTFKYAEAFEVVRINTKQLG